jgi:hypothetical protein
MHLASRKSKTTSQRVRNHPRMGGTSLMLTMCMIMDTGLYLLAQTILASPIIISQSYLPRKSNHHAQFRAILSV